MGRDPFAGFGEQPYSLMPYQYGYSNPVLWSDPSGRCVGWLWGSETCQFTGFDPRNYNRHDAEAYFTGVGHAALESVQGVVAFATNDNVRQEVGRQVGETILQAADNPGAIPGMIGNSVARPFQEFAEAVRNDDSYAMGRAAFHAGSTIVATAAVVNSGISLARNVGNAAQTLSRPPNLRRDPYLLDRRLPAGQGRTDEIGQILISPHGTVQNQLEALAHEQLHRLLTPRGRLAGVRANISTSVYKNSQLFQFTEEFLAETTGRLRTGSSLRQSLRANLDLFSGKYTTPLGILSPVGVITEATVLSGCTVVAGTSLGKWLANSVNNP